MPLAQNILSRITSSLGLQRENIRFAVDRMVDANKSIYKAVIPKFLYKPPFGFPRFVDIPEIRRLSATPFVEMCISTIIDEIAAVEWEIVPKDKDSYNEEHIEQVKTFFDNPNVNKESFEQQLRKILRDVLSIDSGVWIKVFAQDGLLRELYVRDGGCLDYNTLIETEFGQIPIGKIVKKKIKCKVKTWNFEKKCIEWKPIMNWVNNGPATKWVRLWAKSHDKYRSLTSTSHKIWTKDGYKLGEELKVGDKIYTQCPEGITETQIYKKEIINKYDTRYDIEVADNHNFFAKGKLVSNTFTKNVDIFGTFANKADIIPADFSQSFSNPKLWTNDGNVREEYASNLHAIAEKAAYFQYGWITGARPMPFGTREVIYIMRNPRPDSIYGRSAVEICIDVVQMLVYGIDNNLEYFTDNNIPKGFFQMTGANNEDIRQFSEKWRESLRGKNEVGDYRKRFYHMPIMNQEGDFKRVSFSNAELELISQQQWFSKVLWSCFGVTPSELGFTESSNRATEIVQSKVFRRKALRPILNLIEFHINTEIMPEFETGVYINANKPDEQLLKGINDVKFQFNMYDLTEDLEKHKLYQMQLRNGLKTPNEIREELGLEPLEGGDEIKKQGVNPFERGMMPQLPETREVREELREEQKAIELKKVVKRGNKYCVIHCSGPNAGKVIKCFPTKEQANKMHRAIQASKYGKKAFATPTPLILKEFEELSTADNLNNFFKKILKDQEKKVMELIELHRGGKYTIEQVKDLNQQVIREIKEIVDMETADEAVRKVIETVYLKALEEIEIDFNRNFMPNRDELNFMLKHALDNVTDLSEYIKSKLRKELEFGLMQGEGITKIKNRIKEVFDVAESRAEMIARTETIRASNTGALEAYKQTGMKGKLEWIATIDNKTCQWCKVLNGKTVDINTNFKDAQWEGKHAPRHPNCRCTIVFHPE